MITVRPKSLVVFAPSYAIACDCLKVDHGIDPRHPALVFIKRVHDLRRWSYPIPLIVVDPLAKRSLDDDREILLMRAQRRARDWTKAEHAAVSIRKAGQ